MEKIERIVGHKNPELGVNAEALLKIVEYNEDDM